MKGTSGVSGLIIRNNGVKSRFVRQPGTNNFSKTNIPGVTGSVLNRSFGIFGGGNPHLRVRNLAFDCVSVATNSLGRVLFGSPPEVIKKILPEVFAGKEKPPSYLVLAKDSIHPDGSIINEAEFVLYASFFMGQKPLTIIGEKEQVEAIKIVLRESLFGPEDLYGPQQKAESDFFKVKGKDGRALDLNDFAKFVVLDSKDSKVFEENGVKIINLGQGKYKIIEDSVDITTVDTSQFIKPAGSLVEFGKIPFDPPEFGVTFVGTSSGFDTERRTTSLIIWSRGKGIFVDPLANPISECHRLGIDPKDLKAVLLTHPHADHDAGVLQWVLGNRKVRLVTSKIIFESFIRKANAQAGTDIRHLINFIEVNPGEMYNFFGTDFKISSALHSIPTIRFIAEFIGDKVKKSIAYSADTLFLPEKLIELQKLGIITAERLAELQAFVLNSQADILIHEAGGPPIHTLGEDLNKLPEEIRKKMKIVHTGKLGNGVVLPIAEAGETTELIPSRKSTVDFLDAISENSIISALSVNLLQRLLERSKFIQFVPGNRIVKQGDPGDTFYIIIKGKVEVNIDGESVAVLEKGDFFGEEAVIKDKPRNADVEALTAGTLLAVDKEQFRKVMDQAPQFAQSLMNVIQSRPSLYQLIFLAGMTQSQKNEFFAGVTFESHNKGSVLIRQGDEGSAMYVIKQGKVKVTVVGNDGKIRLEKTLGEGEIVGEMSLIKGIPCTATVEVLSENAEVFKLSRERFNALRDEIPSFTFNLQRLAEKRIKEQS